MQQQVAANEGVQEQQPQQARKRGRSAAAGAADTCDGEPILNSDDCCDSDEALSYDALEEQTAAPTAAADQNAVRKSQRRRRDNVTLSEIGDSNVQQPEDTEAAEQLEEAAPAAAAAASTVGAKRKAPCAKRTLAV
jgi:hypothetical protein